MAAPERDPTPALLATKLHAPRRRRGAVDRPRLAPPDADDDGPAVTLVSAPAGFGKTTLLAGWIAERAARRRPTAWLSLDAADDDPTTFWTYVVAALQAVVPGAGADARAADLRFTDEETAAYLTGSMGLALDPGDVTTLAARTEGWAAALQLAALSLQGRDHPASFVAEFAGDDRFVVDYLADEVLENQPDDVREFLLQTSVLERFTADLCDAVTGATTGRAMLERLDRANLFLVPLDDRRHWYRYHHLFADVLRAHLLADQPGRTDELHRRAGAWFEAQGDAPEAIRHALAAHDVDGAARLVELSARSLFRTRQEATARRWLGALPPEVFRERPVLAITLVGARMISGETHGVAGLLDAIESDIAPAADASSIVVFDHEELAGIPAQIAVYRAALALGAGDVATTIARAEQAVGLAAPSDHLRRGSAAALLGLARWTMGEIEPASRHYAQSITSLTAAGHLNDVLGCSIALADMQITMGRLADAAATYAAGLRLAETEGLVRGRPDMHVGLAEVALERGDHDTARHHLDAAARLGEPAGLPQHAYRWRTVAARLRMADGDTAAALSLLHDAERVYDTDMSPPVRPVPAVAARAHVVAGDLAAAQRWIVASGVGPDDSLSYLREYEHVTLAHVLIADGSTTEAARLLHRLLDAAEQGGRLGTAAEIRDLLAHIDHGNGRARRQGDPSRRPEALVDALSERELQVLRLLRGDLSGPEIARELVVSLNTVRTHTKHIYTKLGATNRREAVRRAADLGL